MTAPAAREALPPEAKEARDSLEAAIVRTAHLIAGYGAAKKGPALTFVMELADKYAIALRDAEGTDD
jgi:hypothetical protein